MEIVENTCGNCEKLKAEFELSRHTVASNFAALKEKIISTDLLIRKYNTKNQEYDTLLKKFEDSASLSEQLKRDCLKYESELVSVLKEVEPLRKERDALSNFKTDILGKLNTATEEVEALKKTNEQLSRKVIEHEKEKDKMKNKVTHLGQELRNRNKELSHAKKFKEEAEELKNELQNTNKNIRCHQRKYKRTLKHVIRFGNRLESRGLLAKTYKKIVDNYCNELSSQSLLESNDEVDQESFSDSDCDAAGLELEKLLLENDAESGKPVPEMLDAALSPMSHLEETQELFDSELLFDLLDMAVYEKPVLSPMPPSPEVRRARVRRSISNSDTDAHAVSLERESSQGVERECSLDVEGGNASGLEGGNASGLGGGNASGLEGENAPGLKGESALDVEGESALDVEGETQCVDRASFPNAVGHDAEMVCLSNVVPSSDDILNGADRISAVCENQTLDEGTEMVSRSYKILFTPSVLACEEDADIEADFHEEKGNADGRYLDPVALDHSYAANNSEPIRLEDLVNDDENEDAIYIVVPPEADELVIEEQPDSPDLPPACSLSETTELLSLENGGMVDTTNLTCLTSGNVEPVDDGGSLLLTTDCDAEKEIVQPQSPEHKSGTSHESSAQEVQIPLPVLPWATDRPTTPCVGMDTISAKAFRRPAALSSRITFSKKGSLFKDHMHARLTAETLQLLHNSGQSVSLQNATNSVENTNASSESQFPATSNSESSRRVAFLHKGQPVAKESARAIVFPERVEVTEHNVQGGVGGKDFQSVPTPTIQPKTNDFNFNSESLLTLCKTLQSLAETLSASGCCRRNSCVETCCAAHSCMPSNTTLSTSASDPVKNDNSNHSCMPSNTTSSTPASDPVKSVNSNHSCMPSNTTLLTPASDPVKNVNSNHFCMPSNTTLSTPASDPVKSVNSNHSCMPSNTTSLAPASDPAKNVNSNHFCMPSNTTSSTPASDSVKSNNSNKPVEVGNEDLQRRSGRFRSRWEGEKEFQIRQQTSELYPSSIPAHYDSRDRDRAEFDDSTVTNTRKKKKKKRRECQEFDDELGQVSNLSATSIPQKAKSDAGIHKTGNGSESQSPMETFKKPFGVRSSLLPTTESRSSKKDTNLREKITDCLQHGSDKKLLSKTLPIRNTILPAKPIAPQKKDVVNMALSQFFVPAAKEPNLNSIFDLVILPDRLKRPLSPFPKEPPCKKQKLRKVKNSAKQNCPITDEQHPRDLILETDNVSEGASQTAGTSTQKIVDHFGDEGGTENAVEDQHKTEVSVHDRNVSDFNKELETEKPVEELQKTDIPDQTMKSWDLNNDHETGRVTKSSNEPALVIVRKKADDLNDCDTERNSEDIPEIDIAGQSKPLCEVNNDCEAETSAEVPHRTEISDQSKMSSEFNNECDTVCVAEGTQKSAISDQSKGLNGISNGHETETGGEDHDTTKTAAQNQKLCDSNTEYEMESDTEDRLEIDTEDSFTLQSQNVAKDSLQPKRPSQSPKIHELDSDCESQDVLDSHRHSPADRNKENDGSDCVGELIEDVKRTERLEEILPIASPTGSEHDYDDVHVPREQLEEVLPIASPTGSEHDYDDVHVPREQLEEVLPIASPTMCENDCVDVGEQQDEVARGIFDRISAFGWFASRSCRLVQKSSETDFEDDMVFKSIDSILHLTSSLPPEGHMHIWQSIANRLCKAIDEQHVPLFSRKLVMWLHSATKKDSSIETAWVVPSPCEKKCLNLLKCLETKTGMQRLEEELYSAAVDHLTKRDSPIAEKVVLSRFLITLFKQQGNIEKTKVFYFDLAYRSFSSCGLLLLNSFLLWPEIFEAPSNSIESPLLKVLTFILKEKPSAVGVTKSSSSERLTKIPLATKESFIDATQLVLVLIEILKDGDWKLSLEAVRAVEVLCRAEGWQWTNDFVMRQQLWPILQAWCRQMEIYSDVSACSCLYLLGCLCKQCPTSNPAPIQEVLTVTNALLAKSICTPVAWCIQESCLMVALMLMQYDKDVALIAVKLWLPANANNLSEPLRDLLTSEQLIQERAG